MVFTERLMSLAASNPADKKKHRRSVQEGSRTGRGWAAADGEAELFFLCGAQGALGTGPVACAEQGRAGPVDLDPPLLRAQNTKPESRWVDVGLLSELQLGPLLVTRTAGT